MCTGTGTGKSTCTGLSPSTGAKARVYRSGTVGKAKIPGRRRNNIGRRLRKSREGVTCEGHKKVEDCNDQEVSQEDEGNPGLGLHRSHQAGGLKYELADTYEGFALLFVKAFHQSTTEAMFLAPLFLLPMFCLFLCSRAQCLNPFLAI